MSVGFQLSYLAVLGIVYFHPTLHRLWEPENKVTSFIWETTSISIAAQLATFPLGLLYFHQFPNYFVIANLFVIPISSIILIMGLVMLLVSFVTSVAGFIAYILTTLIKLMNFIVFTVESFPFSLIDNVDINMVQCWLIIAIIISIVVLTIRRKFKYIIVTFCLVGWFSSIQWMNLINSTNHSKLTIYNVRGHTAIDLIDQGNTFFIADSILRTDRYKIKFHIEPNRLLNGIDQVTLGDHTNIMRTFAGCNIVCWKGLHLLNVDDREFESPLTTVDYLIVSNNAVRDIKSIQHLNFKTLIIDSSNAWRVADNLIKQSHRQHLALHSILHDGAYVINF
jgi:competence protein ComEC